MAIAAMIFRPALKSRVCHRVIVMRARSYTTARTAHFAMLLITSFIFGSYGNRLAENVAGNQGSRSIPALQLFSPPPSSSLSLSLFSARYVSRQNRARAARKTNGFAEKRSIRRDE